MANPPTYRIGLTLNRDDAKQAEVYLSKFHLPPPSAVGLRENSAGTWQVDAYFDEPPDTRSLSVGLVNFGVQSGKIDCEKLDDIDWVARSQKGLHAVQAGRFVVHGSHDRNRVSPHRWSIEIDAGQAFGTAHHGSTLGCLRALDELARRRTFRRILDVGTGTGVLAIAAARLWRAQVVASDLDPVASEIAEQNLRLNGVGADVRTLNAAGLNHHIIRRHAPFDLVIANILAGPLVRMAHGMARVLRPGGIVVLSGITREQAGRVAAAYGAAGFARHRGITISDWVTLTLVLRQR